VATARGSARWFDESLSFTFAHATFDDGSLVPYVPQIVARSDTSLTSALPYVRLLDHPFLGTLGFSAEYVGIRALPFNQQANPTLDLSASASLRWDYVKVSLLVDNLTDAKYPLSEFFYASNFLSRSYPTLVPSELFTAAAPRTVMLTVALVLDKESDR
jgi:hypothetical protein